MQRDTRFAAAVADQARALGYRVVVTDGSRSVQDTAEEAYTLFDQTTR
jgi:nicotinamidase-related amidase